MSPDLIKALIIFVSVSVLIIYGIYKFTQYANRILLESYQRIQQKYTSLQLSKDEGMVYSNIKSNLLKGSIQKMPFICFDFTTGSGKSMTHWTQFEFQHGLKLNGYTLHLAAEHIFHKMGKSLNLVKEMEIGVEGFDKRFLIQSSNEILTKRVLTMSIQEKLKLIPTYSFGVLNIDDSTLIFKVPYNLSHKTNYINFIQAIEFSQELIIELKRSL